MTESRKDKIENWFEIKKYDTGVIAIGEPYHSEEVFSYLIIGERADLLIDTGMGVKPIYPFINTLRNPFKKIHVLNTHWHFDHIGGNSEFPLILAPKKEGNLIKMGWKNEELQKYGFTKEFGDNIPQDFDPDEFYLPQLENVSAILEEGVTIDLGNRKIRVLETAGHTKGSICLFEEETGLLFTSDLLYQGPLYCFDNDSSIDEYISSLLKLYRMINKIKVIHPGHNYSENSPDLIVQALEIFNSISCHEPPSGTENGIATYSHPEIPRLSVLVKHK